MTTPKSYPLEELDEEEELELMDDELDEDDELEELDKNAPLVMYEACTDPLVTLVAVTAKPVPQ